ncbi:hypothetical protein Gogos_011583 [Gossypium gossypioides]|uniref:Uncharacterized protein n=1 Tax=Gossypium gossypioides TaxID=34282 RepID=A0A7J9BQ40_GOSGO|nr:hypothetical protein [Gossypium gossypioides]
MLTMTYLKRMRKKMREMMFTFQMMVTLMKIVRKGKTYEISTSHFKPGKKKSSKQIGGAVRLSGQIEKLCNAADNMSQATCSLTPAMDPYSIPQAIKVFDNM